MQFYAFVNISHKYVFLNKYIYLYLLFFSIMDSIWYIPIYKNIVNSVQHYNNDIVSQYVLQYKVYFYLTKQLLWLLKRPLELLNKGSTVMYATDL